ncbi:actin cytoskeleton protein [Pseudohyphozyma bogoriensis]|nr:actin cytoskeleton protein [Pseudohyphozyma bogoriensis]
MSTEPTTYSVTVSNLSASTTHPTLEHFFSFCGKIASIAQEGTTAKVTFNKESAAKTALLLNGGTLEGSQITVTSDDIETPALANAKPVASTAPTPAEKEGHELEQEDKPRSAVVAEYLAHGYVIGDSAIERAIAADQQYGISSRFLNFFTPLASKVQAVAQPHVEKASAKLAEVDEKQGLSLKANAAAIIGSKYYQNALSSPFGSKVHAFYTSTQKQVLDVHEEAVRIRNAKKTTPVGPEDPTAPTPSAGTADQDGPAQTTVA